MTKRPPSDDDDLESIAHNLLGVNFPGKDELDDSVEVDGLSLDDLGFGPTPAEIEAAKAAAQPSPEPPLKSEPHPNILSLLGENARPPEREKAADEPAPVKSRRTWFEEVADDDFGAGLMGEPTAPAAASAASAKPASRVEPRGVDLDDDDEDFLDGVVDEVDAQVDDEEGSDSDDDDFGAGLTTRSQRPAKVDDEAEDRDEPASAKPEKDAYWDALESWDWNDDGSKSRKGGEGRGRDRGRPDRQSERPAGRSGSRREGSREGAASAPASERSRSKREAESARRAPEVKAEVSSERGEHSERSERSEGRRGRRRGGQRSRQEDTTQENTTQENTTQERPAQERSAPEQSARQRPAKERQAQERSREERPRQRRPREDSAREESPREQPTREARALHERPVRPIEPPPAPVDADDDDFGVGVMDAPRTKPAGRSPGVESGGESEDPSKKPRRRRRRGRRPQSDGRVEKSNVVESDLDLDDESGDDFETSAAEEVGDGFGSGLGLESDRPRRRPPRQQKATRVDADPPRRAKVEREPAAERPRPQSSSRSSERTPERTQRTERSERAERSQRAERTERQPAEAPDPDRYKGIPTWVEAINLLARKPPNVRSGGSGEGRGGRGRRGGGGGGGRDGGNRPRRG